MHRNCATDLFQRLDLPRGEVHVWLLEVGQIAGPGLFPESILTPSELQKLHGFLAPLAKREYLAGRWLIRTLLSKYFPHRSPTSWTFSTGQYGKPELTEKFANIPIRFNLSHSSGMVACAVTSGPEIGVDIESIDRSRDHLELARSVFSTHESGDIARYAGVDSRERFFSYWTLKEAYIKARGMGLALPLDRFSFHLPRKLGPTEDIRITFDPRLQDDPTQWRFSLTKPLDGFLLAIASHADSRLPVIFREAFSLVNGPRRIVKS